MNIMESVGIAIVSEKKEAEHGIIAPAASKPSAHAPNHRFAESL